MKIIVYALPITNSAARQYLTYCIGRTFDPSTKLTMKMYITAVLFPREAHDVH